MNQVTVTIPGSMTDLNTYLKQARRHWGASAQIKELETEKAMYSMLEKRSQIERLELPLDVHVNWICKNRRIDKDNIRFAMKFVLDGLEASRMIPNDGWSEIGDLSDSFSVDKENPRVEVVITGANNE